MTRRRILIASLSGVALAGGAAGAVAATTGADAEQAVIERAAKQLEVSPEKLRDALGDALDAQLDQAVKDGKLTQAQADAIKQRRAQSGRVLGFGHGGPRGHGPGFIKHGFLDGAAEALGLSEAQLHERLRDGDTLAEIAKAENKDLADVKAAVRKDLRERLDAAVSDGKLTSAQRTEMLERFDEHFDAFASASRPPRPKLDGLPPLGP